MSKFGEKAHLAASVISWGVYYNKVVEDVLNKQWKNSTTWWGLKEGMIDLKGFNAVVPDDVKALVEERKKGVIDGTAPIWKGPLKDNAGKEQLAKDQVADDKFLHDIKFYVEGVEGNVPG
jgi:simple sugar transport system substrate-binding protein